MSLSRNNVRPGRHCRTVFAAVIMLVVALGMGGCASPMSSSCRSPFFGGAQDDPPRAETMQEFVGLPRPN